MNRSIARRLAFMFAAVALFVFTLVGTGLFLVLRTQLEQHLRESLDDRTQIARIIVYHAVTPEKWKMAREKLTDMTPRDGVTLYSVWSADSSYHFGKPVTGQVVDRWAGGYARVRAGRQRKRHADQHGRDPAVLQRPAVQLQVAAGYSANARTMRAFGFALAALSALGSLGVLLLSYSVTRIGLAPLTQLTRDASAVSPNNRSQRLNTRSLPLELNDLANSFNGALERLDAAYGRLESFNADVAHELRTPVTILIGQTEVALTRNRSVEDLRHTLQSNLEEFERMRAIINDMLFLARADQGERATGLVDASLAAEVAHTLEFLEIPLEEAHVRAVSTGDALGAGEQVAVRPRVHQSPDERDPALRARIDHQGFDYPRRRSGARGRCQSGRADRARPCSIICSTGFYRAEVSRTNSRENHGLGLAIVKATAEMHGGKVFATSAGGINTFAFSVAASDIAGQASRASDLPRRTSRASRRPVCRQASASH